MGEIIITNPPYLAKNSARRRGLKFPLTNYEDLYQLAVSRMLSSAKYVAAIIPESFITAGLFLDRLNTVISLTDKMFEDTDCPVCLALFSPPAKVKVFSNNRYIGELTELRRFIPTPIVRGYWRFNDPEGEIGLRAVDNLSEASIRFVEGRCIDPKTVKSSSRANTRISLRSDYNVDTQMLIKEANTILTQVRERTYDVVLTAFKGVRKDGMYRRRLDFNLARCILNEALGGLVCQ